MLTMKLPWMSRADRRRWKSARTVADLGELMALWLEGEIASRPGYQPRFGPDEETGHLVPTLAALCRAGYVTTCSQPGFAGTGADGLWWEQCAAVELVVTDAVLFRRLVDAVSAAGMVVRVNDYRDGGVQEQSVVATTCDGEPITTFGGQIPQSHMDVLWSGLDRSLYDQVAHGTYVSIVAPEFGPAGDRLWVVLDFLTGLRREDPANPWTTTRKSKETGVAEVSDTETFEVIRYTADVVAVTGDGRLLLIERGWDPFAGQWALPGGHVDPGEDSRHAASRELEEETGVRVPADELVQIGVWDEPGRDPRGRYVTVAYLAVVPDDTEIAAGDDASAARWWPSADLPPLAFDHADIVAATFALPAK